MAELNTIEEGLDQGPGPKPKFDPNKSFAPVEEKKPAFDPSKAFEPIVEKKSSVEPSPSKSSALSAQSVSGGPDVYKKPTAIGAFPITKEEEIKFGPLSSKPKPKPAEPKPVKIDFGTYKPIPLSYEEKQRNLDNVVRTDKEHAGSRLKYVYNNVLRGIGSLSAGAADLVMQGLAYTLPEEAVGGRPEDAIKKWREEATPTIREGLKELVGADVSLSKEAKYDKELFTSAVGSLAHIAPIIATGAFAPELVAPQFMVSGYDGGLQMINSTEEGRNQPESTKTLFGASVGVANGLLMKLNFDKILGANTEKLAGDLAVKTINDLSKTGQKITVETFENALKQNAQGLRNKAIAAGGKLTETAAHGFLFGTAMEATTQGIQEATNAITNKQIFDPQTWGERVGKIIESGVHLATGNLILGGAMLPFSGVRNYINEKVATAKGPEDIQKLKDEIITAAEQGNIRQDDIQGISDLVDSYVSTYSKMPATVPQEKKTEVADDIAKRNELADAIKQKEEEIKNLDEAFKPDAEKELKDLQSRYDELNAKIAESGKPIVQEPVKEEIKAEEVKLDPELLSFFANKEDFGMVKDVVDRMDMMRDINEKDLAKAEDVLYTLLDQNPAADNLIEPILKKIQDYEFKTKTEVVETTETRPIEGAYAAKTRIEIKPALEKSIDSPATIELASGETKSGTLKLKEGNYVLSVEGEKPIIIGEKAITDRDLVLPSEERVSSPVELDENGNVKSVTFETKDGNLITIEDPEKALDLAIQLHNQIIGDVPDAVFERAYEQVQVPSEIEVPVRPLVQRFAVAYAPFRQGNIKDVTEYKKAFDNPKYKLWRKMGDHFAKMLGLKVELQEGAVGVYGETSADAEASAYLRVVGTKKQIDLFGALMGSMAPEGQRSIMKLEYDEAGNASEIKISFENQQDAIDFLNNRMKYGVEDISLLPESNSVVVLDFGNFENDKFNNDYGSKVKEYDEKQFKSEGAFGINEESYEGILRKSVQEFNKRGGGDDIAAVLELAQKRAGRLRGEFSKKSEQAKIEAQKATADYIKNNRERLGLPEDVETRVERVDPEFAQQTAKDYDNLPVDDSKNPEVISAYNDAVKEINEQYDYLTKELGIKVEFVEEDPYPDSEAMFEDIVKNKKMRIYKGGEPHPFLGESSLDANGITANEKLRAVHDYFGHFVNRNQFGKLGEERAWVDHSKMFSPNAQRALTTETRGQNSWVNFSGKNKEALDLFEKGHSLIKEGKVKEGNKLIADGKSKFQFAVQKVALLPESRNDWTKYQTGAGKPKLQAKLYEAIGEKMAPSETFTSENIATVNPEKYTGVQKTVVSGLKNIVKAVSGLVEKATKQKLSVTLHNSQKSYEKAVIDADGTLQDAKTKGFYISKDGAIHLNMNRVTEDTLAHEATHPILDYLADKSPDKIDNLYAQLSKIKEAEGVIERAKKVYADETEVQQKKEAITDFIARVASGDIQLTKSNFKAIRDYVINMLNAIGIKMEKPIESIEDLRDLAQTISKKFYEGQEIKMAEGAKEKREGAQFARPEKSASEALNQFEKGTVIASDKLKSFTETADEKIKKVLDLFAQKIKSIKISGKRETEGAAFYDTKSKEIDINKNSNHWKDVEAVDLVSSLAHEYVHHLIDESPNAKGIESELQKIKDDLIANKPENMSESVEKIYDYMTAEKNSPQEILTYAVSNPEVRDILSKHAEVLNKISNSLFGDKIIEKPKEAQFAREEEKAVEANPVFYKNAVEFANQSEFNNKLDFKKAIQNSLNKGLKELRKIYGAKFNPTNFKADSTKRYLTDSLVKEAYDAIKKFPHALGWYKEKISDALSIMGTIHPEIIKKEEDKTAFIAALAITSNGNKVDKNFEYAEEQYSYFKKNGRFNPNLEFGDQQQAVIKSFKLINAMLDEGMTMNEIGQLFRMKFKAKDLKVKIDEKKVKNFATGELADQDVYGATIIGPKIGNGFFMNLFGDFSQLTMDRWFTRTIGRLTGTLIEYSPELNKKARVRFREALDAVKKDPETLLILKKATGGISKIGDAELATLIKKLSAKKDFRKMMQDNELLDELRKSGNNLANVLTGEKEAPSNGSERKFIRDVMADVQARLKSEYGVDINMADLQAALWYPEKALYSSFKKGQMYDDIVESYSEETAPDYANAAKKIAKQNNISDEQISKAVTDGRKRLGEDFGEGYPEIGKAAGEYGKELPEQFKKAATKVERARKQFSRAEGLDPEKESKLIRFIEDQRKSGETDNDIRDVLVDYGFTPDQVNTLMEGKSLVTGIKIAKTEEERIARGLQPIEVEMKRGFGEVMENAKQMIGSRKIDPKLLSAEISLKPRPISAEEGVALMIDRMDIMKELARQNDIFDEAVKDGNEIKADIIRSQINTLREALDLNDRASRLSGYEKGLALSIRRMLIKEDYSYENQLMRFKTANNGKEVPKAYQDKLRDLTKKLSEANKKLEQYEKQEAFKTEQKSVSEVKTTEQGKREFKSRSTIIRDKIINAYRKSIASLKAKKEGGAQFAKEEEISPEKVEALTAITPSVNDWVKAYAESGETNLKKIIADIHKQLSTDIPDITIEDIENTIVGKYKAAKEAKKLTPEQITAKANVEKVKDEIDRLRDEIEIKNRTKEEKVRDYFHGWHRFSILSGIPSLGKIATAALGRGVTSRSENVISAALSKIPGISYIAKKAPREGGLNPKAEAKAFTTWFDKATRDDFRNVMQTGLSELDYLYGNKKEFAQRIPAWMEFFGRMHGALKLLPKRAEFFRSLEMRTASAIKNGENINDPIVQEKLAVSAYNDAARAIFMQDNPVTKAYNSAVNNLEKTSPNLASTLKILFPIVKVPTNYVFEESSYMIGALKAAYALRKGVKNLTPEQADYFMRAMKKQSVGLAFMALGYWNPDVFGGYYTGKRKKEDLEPGDIELFGMSVPHWMTHTPLLEMLQVGATIRRAEEAKLKKNEDIGPATGIGDVFKGQLTQVPFYGGAERAIQAFDAKNTDRALNWLYGTMESVTTPQLIQNIADWTDTKEGEKVKRTPDGFLQQLMSGVPGLRKMVPEKVEGYSKKELDTFDFLTNRGVNVPEFSRKESYKVKTDNEHPDGVMTDEEYKDFIEKTKKITMKKFEEALSEKYAVTEDGQVKMVEGNELSREDLQTIVNSIHDKAINEAKKELGLTPEKKKRKVEKL